MTEYLTKRVHKLARWLSRLEDQVAENQDRLDALAARFETVTGNLRNEVDDLQTRANAGETPLDFSKLDAAVSSLEEITAAQEGTAAPSDGAPAAGEPTPPAPADTPAPAPVDTGEVVGNETVPDAQPVVADGISPAPQPADESPAPNEERNVEAFPVQQ